MQTSHILVTSFTSFMPLTLLQEIWNVLLDWKKKTFNSDFFLFDRNKTINKIGIHKHYTFPAL